MGKVSAGYIRCKRAGRGRRRSAEKGEEYRGHKEEETAGRRGDAE